jgi:hypothetical protein
MFWATAAYRADEIAPDITRAFSDFGWFGFVYQFPAFTLFWVILGIAILQDRSAPPVFPRWLGWLTTSVGLSFAFGGLMGLAKTGPIARNGALAYWFVLIIFCLWDILISVYTLRVIGAEEKRLKGQSDDHVMDQEPFELTEPSVAAVPAGLE